MTNRQIGKFCLTRKMVEDAPDVVAEIFARMKFVPTRCEQIWHADGFEYYGISELFAEVSPAMAVPEYKIVITQNEDGTLCKVEVNRI